MYARAGASTAAPPAEPLVGTFNDPDVAADRAAIAAEELLPPPGTPERDRLDHHQRELVAGLLLGSKAAQSRVGYAWGTTR